MKIPDIGPEFSRGVLAIIGLLLMMTIAERWTPEAVVRGVYLGGFAAVVLYLVWNGWIRKRQPS